MTERQLQFRVGIFVSVALASIVGLIFEFGEIQTLLRPKYTVKIRFKSASGIAVSTPVRRNGVLIGSVKAVQFDDENGGLIVSASIKDGVHLWPDGRVRLNTSLLGDSSIEFLPGKSNQALKDGDTVEAEPAVDPLNIVARMEQNVALLIDSFQQTSHEWQSVGHNLNSLLQTNQGNLHTVVARAAEALTEVAHTMKTVDQTLQDTSRLIGDPQTQENLRKTMSALPVLAEETQRTVVAVRVAVQKMDENLTNLNAVTAPLAKNGVTLATRVENTLSNVETLTEELSQFAKIVNSKDGTIHKLAADPQLYVNMNRSAESAAMLLRQLEPVVRDLRVFSDKVARHPELVGVSGALRGSSGLKDPEDAAAPRPQQQRQ
ncbi:MAG TPA: MlaD family protein [Planctomycetaceae bacterium]|jgi:phospholipid/cholesterol/gamma-HCH transport system substrate-binding protein|nr:MlaD family protein [Planctomycetaceae bacterium]